MREGMRSAWIGLLSCGGLLRLVPRRRPPAHQAFYPRPRPHIMAAYGARRWVAVPVAELASQAPRMLLAGAALTADARGLQDPALVLRASRRRSSELGAGASQLNHEERVGRTRVTGAAGEDGGGRQTSSRKHLSRHAVASEAVERIRIRTERL
ncbi:unnamed protein product [Miscanthus lutarioriparius]|uniref:Uncharacterized protein n=1 Tax=Miscanthus lutarioriparius TaxID=422564 RepID=A0A811QW97_9POAL|nr:unnamed protein product [Miscanthus lutarioriparius]